MKGKYWVMILAIVLIVVLIVALAACGNLRDGTEVEDDDGALAAILANLNKKTAEKVEVEDEKPANNGGGHTGGGGNGGNTGSTGDNGNTENTGDNGESGTGESGNERSSTLGQGITDIVIGSNSLFGEGRIARGIGEIIDAIFGG